MSDQVCLLNMKKRKYTKHKRAEQQEQTRERIVDAVMSLHEELGPANTSIKAVAEKAGVQRLTVYRYFPDEASMFSACTTKWFGLNPPPQSTEWAAIQDAEQRSYAALLAFNQYYRRTATMWQGVYRDANEVEAMQKPLAGFEAFLDQQRDDLLAAWKAIGKRKQQLSISLRHCLRFSTWLSLKDEKLNDKQIAELMMSWIK